MVDSKYAYILYKVKQKLPFFSLMEFLQLEPILEDDESRSGIEDVGERWEGKTEVREGELQAGNLNLLDVDERRITACLL